MAGNFEWQTEEESRWDDLPSTDDHGRPPPKRRWWLIGILLLLVIAVGGFIYYQVDRRIEATTAALQQDVISSTNLVRRAVAEQDGELFLTLLSGRGPNWIDAQREMFRQDLIINRARLGFTAVSTDPINYDPEDDLAAASITLAPELNAAVVIVDQPYTITLPDGTTASITLQNTAVYRRGDTRWLLSPPEDAFWGNWVTDAAPGAPIHVIYRTRDEAIVQRLRGDLIPIIASLCTTLEGLTCPSGVPFVLRFADDPAVLLAAHGPLPITASPQGLQIDLPTPTVVGLPVDEAGYEALLRSYARQIASAYIAVATEYNCCAHAAFFQAMVDWQMARLGLRDWPITAETYARQGDNHVNIDYLNQLWNIDAFDAIPQDELWQIYIAVEFLRHAYPEMSIADVQRTLSTQHGFQQWLGNLPGEQAPDTQTDASDVINQWLVFSYSQGVPTDLDNVPYPAQDIQLSCSGNLASPDNRDLVRYHLAVATAVSERSLANTPYIAPLPDDSGIIVLVGDQNNEQWELLSWVQDAARSIRGPSQRFALTVGQPSDTPTGLVFLESAIDAPSLTMLAIDLANCDASGCAQRDLPGVPTWSPDGSQVIYAPPNLFSDSPVITPGYATFFGTDVSANSPLRDSTLVRTGKNTAVAPNAFTDAPTVSGFAPFWLDNQTYGYVSLPDDSPHSELVLADATTDAILTTVTIDQLQDALPDAANVRLHTIAYARPNPARPDQLAIVAVDTSSSSAQIFLYDRSTSSAEWRLELGLRASQSLGFSPDGRYLVATGAGTDNLGLDSDTQLVIHDIDAESTAVFPAFSEPTFLAPFDWSSDGKWLAFMMDTNTLALVNPALPHAEITHAPGCSTPIWINQGS